MRKTKPLIKILTLLAMLTSASARERAPCVPDTFEPGQRVVVVDIQPNESGIIPDLKLGEVFTVKRVAMSHLAVQLVEREARRGGTGYFRGDRFCLVVETSSAAERGKP
jgi:hypothetical protein